MSCFSQDVPTAVSRLRGGGLVAFPTETVYGLGGDACSESAVRRIFQAKGRPANNPLIVHVADEGIARRYAESWPPHAAALARAFWPGPLTMVLPRRRVIPDVVSAGGETIGLRVPDHPLALQLLRAFDGPIAAPSANRSSRISPTTAEHVRQELGSAVDLILDGGPCRVGIESTVIDLSDKTPTVLRPGSITREQLELVIGPVWASPASQRGNQPVRSPGQQEVHYSPRATAYRLDGSHASALADDCAAHPDRKMALILIAGSSATATLAAAVGQSQSLFVLPPHAADYARRLYLTLRAADETRPVAIWIEMPPNRPQWAAVCDRLRRATVPWSPSEAANSG